MGTPVWGAGPMQPLSDETAEQRIALVRSALEKAV